MRAFLTVFVAAASVSISAAPATSEIKAALQKVIPPNWVVAESSGSLLLSNRDEVTFYNAMQMRSFLERDKLERVKRGNRGHFVMKIMVGPFLSQELYDEIRRTLPRRGSYASEIPFQAFYSLREDALPDGYGPGYSVYIATTLHPYYSIWPESAKQECVRVLDAVRPVFEHYRETGVVQPDAAANRSQPVHSDTNQTPVAAGSGR